jgi:hypothetical protein
MRKTTPKPCGAEFKAKVALEAVRGELTLSQLGAKDALHQARDRGLDGVSLGAASAWASWVSAG